jgi:hypothetical protein
VRQLVAVLPRSLSSSDSSTILVNSRTNSGTPLVLMTNGCCTSAGSDLVPATRATMASTWARGKRLNVTGVTWARKPQGG